MVNDYLKLRAKHYCQSVFKDELTIKPYQLAQRIGDYETFMNSHKEFRYSDEVKDLLFSYTLVYTFTSDRTNMVNINKKIFPKSDKKFMKKYPDSKIVSSKMAFNLMKNMFGTDFSERQIVISEGSKVELGKHVLNFIAAPNVHWPEVMFCYDEEDKILFSADAFGKFGTLDAKDDDGWACEARRYYFNIVGKYGMQVQNVLKKLAGTEVKAILPLHGPALTENLEYYLGIYNTWSSYQPEDKGVLVAYASIHGNTRQAAEELGEMLTKKGAPKVVVSDLAREDIAEVIEDAFRYDKMILMAPSYDAGVFPIMEEFLCHLRDKAYQNRKVAMVENGSWAPSAARVMKTYVEKFKNVELVGETVTIRSSLKPDTREALEKLADAVINA